jgi:hypothetical protein
MKNTRSKALEIAAKAVSSGKTPTQPGGMT